MCNANAVQILLPGSGLGTVWPTRHIGAAVHILNSDFEGSYYNVVFAWMQLALEHAAHTWHTCADSVQQCSFLMLDSSCSVDRDPRPVAYTLLVPLSELKVALHTANLTVVPSGLDCWGCT